MSFSVSWKRSCRVFSLAIGVVLWWGIFPHTNGTLRRLVPARQREIALGEAWDRSPGYKIVHSNTTLLQLNSNSADGVLLPAASMLQRTERVGAEPIVS